MNTQKEVFNKLFKEDKVELAAQKIELSLVDDIVKVYNSIKSKADGLSMNARRAAQELDETSSKAKQLLKEIEKSESDSKKLVNSAKDLGIQLPSEASVAIRQLQAYRSDLSELQSATEKAGDIVFGML
jgi:uncharacterized membrane protein